MKGFVNFPLEEMGFLSPLVLEISVIYHFVEKSVSLDVGKWSSQAIRLQKTSPAHSYVCRKPGWHTRTYAELEGTEQI